MAARVWIVVYFCSLFHVSQAAICKEDICEYEFDIRHTRTMTTAIGKNGYDVALNGTKLQIVENMHKRAEAFEDVGKFVSPDDVITADGYVRTVIAVNGQFPGPTIEVMEGSQVTVTLV